MAKRAKRVNMVVVGRADPNDRGVFRDPKVRARINPPLSKEAMERIERLEGMTMSLHRLRNTYLD